MFAAGDLVGADGEWETAGATPIVLRLAVDDGDLWAELAGRQVTEQLQQAGFVVQASGEPSGSATGMALASGAADLAILPFDATPFPSIAVKEFTDSLGPPGQNGSEDWPNLDDPTVDALLATAEQQLNPVKAQPIYAQVDAQLWTNMAALPLFAEPAVLAWSVQTYAVTPNFHGPNLFGTLSTWQLRRPEAAAASSSPSS
jgi:ABC-type transport system substrate-binding protein